MDKENILNKEYLIELGAKKEKGKIYSIKCYKVAVFDDGFIFFLSTSLFADRIKGKTISDFDKILEALENYA